MIQSAAFLNLFSHLKSRQWIDKPGQVLQWRCQARQQVSKLVLCWLPIIFFPDSFLFPLYWVLITFLDKFYPAAENHLLGSLRWSECYSGAIYLQCLFVFKPQAAHHFLFLPRCCIVLITNCVVTVSRLCLSATISPLNWGFLENPPHWVQWTPIISLLSGIKATRHTTMHLNSIACIRLHGTNTQSSERWMRLQRFKERLHL